MFMMTPGLSRMARCHADWHQNTGPRMLTWNVLSNRAGSMPMVGPAYGLAAALFTRMSRPPKRSMVAATQASAVSMSPALPANTATSPPMSAAAISNPSILRAVSITLAPASTNPATMAFPMPFEAPVTRATLPSSRISMDRARYWLPCRAWATEQSRPGEPPRRRELALPPPAPGQPRRLVPVGPRRLRPGARRGQAGAALGRLLRLPLVPRHGPRELRGRRGGRRRERRLRGRQGRPRGATRRRRRLHGRRAGDQRPRGMADDGVPHARRPAVLRRHLLPEAVIPPTPGGHRRRLAQPAPRAARPGRPADRG